LLRSPKGWTGPAALGDKKLENFWRAHQVPLPNPKGDPEQLHMLEAWLKSYRPWELFEDQGRVRPELQALSPTGRRRMGSNPMPMAACCAASCVCRQSRATPSPSMLQAS